MAEVRSATVHSRTGMNQGAWRSYLATSYRSLLRKTYRVRYEQIVDVEQVNNTGLQICYFFLLHIPSKSVRNNLWLSTLSLAALFFASLVGLLLEQRHCPDVLLNIFNAASGHLSTWLLAGESRTSHALLIGAAGTVLLVMGLAIVRQVSIWVQRYYQGGQRCKCLYVQPHIYTLSVLHLRAYNIIAYSAWCSEIGSRTSLHSPE